MMRLTPYLFLLFLLATKGYTQLYDPYKLWLNIPKGKNQLGQVMLKDQIIGNFENKAARMIWRIITKARRAIVYLEIDIWPIIMDTNLMEKGYIKLSQFRLNEVWLTIPSKDLKLSFGLLTHDKLLITEGEVKTKYEIYYDRIFDRFKSRIKSAQLKNSGLEINIYALRKKRYQKYINSFNLVKLEEESNNI